MRILVVEDDPNLGSGLSKSLTKLYATDWVQDGETAYHAIISGNYDIVILDLGLPKIDGLQVLKKVKAIVDSSFIILTARDTTDQKITGLDAGADDYIVKPFELEELFARIRATIRRRGLNHENVIEVGKLVVNIDNHTVNYNNTKINLTPKEFQILHSLISRRGKILSKEQLIQKLHGWYDEINSNAVEVHMHNLRKKIPENFIENIRGVGYRFKS